MNSVEKGRVAEAKVTATLISQGLEVFLPMFGNGTCDMIVLYENNPIRIEVKYVTGKDDRFDVALRQVRPNRSTNIVHKFRAAHCDILAAYLAPLDKVVFREAADLDGRTSVGFKTETADTFSDFVSVACQLGRVA